MRRFSGALILFLFAVTMVSCQKDRAVQTSFYYWKTVYDQNDVENGYLDSLHVRKLYIRITDVDVGDSGPIPVSPISFKRQIPAELAVIPVVFIVNKVLTNQTHQQLDNLAGKICSYVNGKVTQSGKTDFEELQIDCDWTRTTRDNYFYLLKRINANQLLKNKKLSATLRLHQLKNQIANGIPPVDRVMLMCYNMGNLRLYGTQNSILEQSELEKYMNKNLSVYPVPVDIGLPLFSWAVVFRQKQYLGIAKRLKNEDFANTKLFSRTATNLYTLQDDLPALALKRGDEIRWETISKAKLSQAANYIQKNIGADTLNIIYFHLDENTLKNYPYETLEETTALFR